MVEASQHVGRGDVLGDLLRARGAEDDARDGRMRQRERVGERGRSDAQARRQLSERCGSGQRGGEARIVELVRDAAAGPSGEAYFPLSAPNARLAEATTLAPASPSASRMAAPSTTARSTRL